GLLLVITKSKGEKGKSLQEITPLDAFLIGVAQGTAVLPGLSRSGSTIASGLGLGLERECTGRFSFLLSIPAVLGAIVLELKESIHNPPASWGPVLVGALVSFLVGFFALRALLWVIRGGRVYAFSYYVIPVGVIAAVIGFINGY